LGNASRRGCPWECRGPWSPRGGVASTSIPVSAHGAIPAPGGSWRLAVPIPPTLGLGANYPHTCPPPRNVGDSAGLGLLPCRQPRACAIPSGHSPLIHCAPSLARTRQRSWRVRPARSAWRAPQAEDWQQAGLTANNAGLLLPSVPAGTTTVFPGTFAVWGSSFGGGTIKLQAGFVDTAGTTNWVDTPNPLSLRPARLACPFDVTRCKSC